MPTIEISGELMEYIKEGIHADGAEGWYCGGISIDLEDYDSFLKHLINNLAWEKALADGKLVSSDTPFPDVRYRETAPRQTGRDW